jgi:hypothetical protein
MGDTFGDLEVMLSGGPGKSSRKGVRVRGELPLQACGGLTAWPKPLQRYQRNRGLALKIRARGLKALYHPGAAALVTQLIPASHRTPEKEQKGSYQRCRAPYSNFVAVAPCWQKTMCV